jgi:uncharacterized membrane protein YoaK (UPF0700 family)
MIVRAHWFLPAALSATAGAVDAIGFLALGGLFTAHITGNLVILAAHYVTGGFGQVGPLLSVPVFVVVLGAMTLAFGAADKSRYPSRRRTLLLLQVVLLGGFLGVGARLGPFADADSATAVFAGMLGVSAMATQNALVRLLLPGSPSTAVLTTNITVLTIDLVTLACKRGKPDELARASQRASLTFPCVVGFLAGCAGGAFLEIHFQLWALALPVILASLSVPLGELWADGPRAPNFETQR